MIKPFCIIYGMAEFDNYPNNTDLILVAIIPKPKDFEIARLLGWYRIPVKNAPKVISVDYLAFYQPGSFGKDLGNRINYFSRVLGHELTTRQQLFRKETDHPRASEEYYKIQIGDLVPLSKPIQADAWRRITFFYTTGALFKNASSIRDLVVEGEERNVLWGSLRERALLDQTKPHAESFNDIDLLEIIETWDQISQNDHSQ
jgi:hypothetical protein